MFNLENSITQWKEAISCIDSVRDDDSLELESHLRDLVTKLGKQQLSEHEAFLVATHRLGHPSELNKEFSKVHGTSVWRKRVLWMLCGCMIYNLGIVWIGALATLTSAGIGMTGMGAMAMASTTLIIWIIGWAAFLAFALRKSKSQISGLDRVPLSWMLAGGFTLLVGWVLNSTGNVLQSEALDANGFGKMFSWQAHGFLAIYPLVFVAIIALVWTLNEPKSDATAAKSTT